MAKGRVVVIDGRSFSTLEEFYEVFAQTWIDGYDGRGGNLDWFNDILWWPFGMEDERIVLVWRNSDESRRRLGHAETVRQLELRGVAKFPNEFTSQAVSDIDRARRGEGPTVFDWIVEIIEDNQECVDLHLE